MFAFLGIGILIRIVMAIIAGVALYKLYQAYF